ncbi:MAG TPA: hydroxymethylglutaryl-CoA synthase, partial [Pelobium sp.]|nr:hydroxymethylglutaryl-CoA synthase [Pelobium sp.]
NWLANSLFADGASAIMVQSEANAKERVFVIDTFYTEVVTEARNEMAWKIGDHGFEMQLTNKVSKQIKSGINVIAKKLLEKAGLTFKDIETYAIHPGGRKILEVCDEVFGLDKNQSEASYQVLKNFGNMSSTTIVFVLNELSRRASQEQSGKNILSFAFGPGLTFESMILKYA